MIKMDCEGCEMNALLGYKKLFPKHLPAMIFVELQSATLSRYGHNSREVVRWIMSQGPGYRLFTLPLEGHNFTEVTWREVEAETGPEPCHACNGVFVRANAAELLLPIYGIS